MAREKKSVVKTDAAFYAQVRDGFVQARKQASHFGGEQGGWKFILPKQMSVFPSISFLLGSISFRNWQEESE